MIKRFCDACNNEIVETANRMLFTKTFERDGGEKFVKVQVDTMVSINGATNSGEICTACIQETVARGTHQRRLTRN